MFFFILPILCFAAPECITNNTDYSSLTKSEEYYQLLTPTYIFTVNVCGAVNDKDDIAVAQPSRAVETYSLGKYSTQEPIEDENGQGFKYTGGYTDGKYQWSTNMYFQCDKSLKEDSVYILNSNQETKQINFILKGPNFCIDPIPEKGRLSGWAIFGIIFAVFVFIVVCVWLAFFIFNIGRGERGLAMLPMTGFLMNRKGSKYYTIEEKQPIASTEPVA